MILVNIMAPKSTIIPHQDSRSPLLVACHEAVQKIGKVRARLDFVCSQSSDTPENYLRAAYILAAALHDDSRWLEGGEFLTALSFVTRRALLHVDTKSSVWQHYVALLRDVANEKEDTIGVGALASEPAKILVATIDRQFRLPPITREGPRVKNTRTLPNEKPSMPGAAQQITAPQQKALDPVVINSAQDVIRSCRRVSDWCDHRDWREHQDEMVHVLEGIAASIPKIQTPLDTGSLSSLLNIAQRPELLNDGPKHPIGRAILRAIRAHTRCDPSLIFRLSNATPNLVHIIGGNGIGRSSTLAEIAQSICDDWEIIRQSLPDGPPRLAAPEGQTRLGPDGPEFRARSSVYDHINQYTSKRTLRPHT